MLVSVLILVSLIVGGLVIYSITTKVKELKLQLKEAKQHLEAGVHELQCEEKRYRTLEARYRQETDDYEKVHQNLRRDNQTLENQLGEYMTNPIKYLVPKHGENIALRLTAKDTGEYKAFTYQGNNDITADMRLKSLDSVNKG